MKTTTILNRLTALKSQREQTATTFARAKATLETQDAEILTLTQRVQKDLVELGIVNGEHDCTLGGTRRIYENPNVKQAILNVLQSKGKAMDFNSVVAAVRKNYPNMGYAVGTIRQALWQCRDEDYEGRGGYFICAKDNPNDARSKLFYKALNPTLG